MPCLTPNHDLAVLLGEPLMNLILTKFFAARPQKFRRISKGMDGVGPFDNPVEPLHVGETGHLLEYELSITARSNGTFIYLFPAKDPTTGLAAAVNELLLVCNIRMRFWDPQTGKRWTIEVPIAARCAPYKNGQDEKLTVKEFRVTAFTPLKLENAIEYIATQMVNAALEKLTFPGNVLVAPPANVVIDIEALTIDNKLLEVDASAHF